MKFGLVAILTAMVVGFSPLADAVTAAPDVNRLTPQQKENLIRATELSEIIDDLQTNYYDRSKIKSVDHLYDVMIDALWKDIDDAHAEYFRITEAEQFAQMMGPDTKFVGIGVSVLGANIDHQGMEITAIYPGSGAERAQLHLGDRIIEVNGVDVTGRSVADIIKMIVGPAHTMIRVTVVDRHGVIRNVAVERRKVEKTDVHVVDLNGIMDVRIDTFSQDIARDVRNQITHLMHGPYEPRGIVIDLRNNGGGDVTSALQLYDLFAPSGVPVVEFRDQMGDVEALSTNSSFHYGCPLVVLVNADSASASELFSGAIQDNHRGVVMGVHSYGKGSMQEERPLFDGSTVKYTVAHFYVGKDKKAVDGIGVEPNIRIHQYIPMGLRRPMDFDLYAFRAIIWQDPTVDNVLQAALTYLRTHAD